MTAMLQLLAQIPGVDRPGLLEMFLHAGVMAWIVAGVLEQLSAKGYAAPGGVITKTQRRGGKYR